VTVGITFTKACFASFFVIFPVVALGQVKGPAAKGGSQVRTRIESRKVGGENARTSNARRTIENLGLDYSFLRGEFREASKQNPRVKFDDIIRANLVAILHSPQTARETTHRVTLELSEKKSLNDAIIKVLRLRPVDAEAAIKAATDRLSQSQVKGCRF
jgi:signal recognition particle subunit SEC65